MEKLISLRNLLLMIMLLPFWLSLAAASESTVKYLPGFHGPLPFDLETGYIGVGEAEELQLFYYFVKSERNPEEDPLLLWLTGGPGCSSFSGLAYEVGPFRFQQAEYNGTLPTLVYNPNSWTKVASMIFIDSPVGTGFSYATTNSSAIQPGDIVQVSHAQEFLRRWLTKHSEFLSNPLYIAGDSYSGITIPAIVQLLSIGNENGVQPMLNLKGYMIGNPITGGGFDSNARIPYAHGMALISYELYQSLEESCGGEYERIDPTNSECLNNLKAFDECLSGIQPGNILDPVCKFASRKPVEIVARRKIMQDKAQPYLAIDPPDFSCSPLLYSYELCKYWANDVQVRKALHIREVKIVLAVKKMLGEFTHLDHKPKMIVVLVLAGDGRGVDQIGDHDIMVPFLGTQTWIRALNYSIVEDWRSWHVQSQVAGYTRTFSNGMTYATVKGGAHTAPENRPKECFAMFRRWINHEPL
ncbi:unnamed protein product [Linum tenue]|uniref:Uncharacterized protein n=1 Tax=Linum tenue TaxID=586396 RepID=A0AAV0P1K7_9ROSI|nr:unnamed protein product [Linum tenue]